MKESNMTLQFLTSILGEMVLSLTKSGSAEEERSFNIEGVEKLILNMLFSGACATILLPSRLFDRMPVTPLFDFSSYFSVAVIFPFHHISPSAGSCRCFEELI